MDDSENGHTYYKPEETQVTLAAKRTRLGQVYLDWAMYPMIETLPEPDGGWEVRFYDLRYTFPGRSVYHEHASELSWERIFAMFKRQLGG